MKNFFAIFLILLGITSTTFAEDKIPTRVSDLQFQDFFEGIKSGKFTNAMWQEVPIFFGELKLDEDVNNAPEMISELEERKWKCWSCTFKSIMNDDDSGSLLMMVDDKGFIQSVGIHRYEGAEHERVVGAALVIVLRNIGLTMSDFVTLSQNQSALKDIWCESINRRIILATEGYAISIIATED